MDYSKTLIIEKENLNLINTAIEINQEIISKKIINSFTEIKIKEYLEILENKKIAIINLIKNLNTLIIDKN